MKTYELTYILSPDTSSEQAEAKARELEASIQAKEGAIIKQSNPIAIALSYQIKKRASGLVGTIEFHMESEKLAEFQQAIQKDGKIARHMLIIKEPARQKKERRAKREASVLEPQPQPEPQPQEVSAPASPKPAEKPKVELKDIEEKLDEILGE